MSTDTTADLLAACKAQHNALDNLLHLCRVHIPDYSPSSAVLLALEAGRAAIVKASQS